MTHTWQRADFVVNPKEAVARGAALLDRVVGPDWDEGITQLDKLDIRSGTHCVCGQLWGTWDAAVAAVGPYMCLQAYSGVLGFSICNSLRSGVELALRDAMVASMVNNKMLGDEWQALIRARRYERARREVEAEQAALAAQVNALVNALDCVPA